MSLSPLGVVEKIGEIALRHPEEIQNAWTLLKQSLLSEVPELNKEPLPPTDEDYDAAVRAKRHELGLDLEDTEPDKKEPT